MEVTLTPGALRKILNGDVTNEREMVPVVQVKELKLIQSNISQQERFKMLLSDGTDLLHGFLGTNLNGLVKEGFLQSGSIVRLTRFTTGVDVTSHRVLVVVKLEMISTKSAINAAMSSESLRSKLVLDTKDGDVKDLKQIVSKDLKAFRKRLRALKIFIHDTRISKDQIRATIKCHNKLTDRFNNVLVAFCCAEARLSPLQNILRLSCDDSEELSCDMLRSHAHTLFKNFRKVTLKSFVKAYAPFVTIKSHDAKKTLLAIQDVVAKGDSLVYRVMHEGFDCRSISHDEDSDDDDDVEEEDSEDDDEEEDTDDDDDDDEEEEDSDDVDEEEDSDDDDDDDDDEWVMVKHEVAPTEF